MSALRQNRWGMCAFAMLLGAFTATEFFAVFSPIAGQLHWPWMIFVWWHKWGWGLVQDAVVIGGIVAGVCCLGTLRRRPTTPVSARWATRRDLRRAGLFASSGVVLGRYKGKIVRHNGPEHVLCVGPTRSGKGVSHVIPTLRDWDGSVLVHDPKMELYQLTHAWRGTFSRVIHFSPTSPDSDCYNPLHAIRRTPEHMLRDAQLLAQMLATPDGQVVPGTVGYHFFLLASEFLAGLMLYGLVTGEATTLGGLNRMLTLEKPWDTLLKDLMGCPEASVQRAAHVAEALADRELSGLQSTVHNALQLWSDPLVDRATSKSDFTLDDLRARQHPLTLYLSVPFSDQERLRPLSRLLVRQVLDHSTQHLRGWRQRLLVLIDEVTALRTMPVLSDGLDYLAGYGVKLDLITPSMTNLAHYYGTRNNFWEGSRVRLVFAPNSAVMAQFFARETGEQTVTKTRQSRPEGGFWKAGTVSTETTTEPLLSPTALQQLKTGNVLLLVGNLPPVVLQQAPYYEEG